MSPLFILSLIIGYFAVLIFISYLTSKGANNQTFFLANKGAPWYLVAFGMLGASLSGITFISVPGKVGNPADQMSYMQMVLGFFVGYFFIAFVLMPVYYRLGVTSIYEYLEKRFGVIAYKVGAGYFLLSRSIGAAIRLLLVASVLQEILFNQWNVPFWVTAMFSIGLIWLYTNRGGIKTIIFTDTLQTAFMLISLGLSIYLIADYLQLRSTEIVPAIVKSQYSEIWQFDGFFSMNRFHFAKEFIGGFLICITMTGMDQDMMQKNLACPNIWDAQKNMISFSIVLVLVNAFFLGLGVLLFMYQDAVGLELPLSAEGNARTDLLFPLTALDTNNFGLALGVFFLLGLIAAAYSSADSALTSLTTSFCIDFLNMDEIDEKRRVKVRKIVHIAVSLLLFIIVLILHTMLDMSAIMMVIFLASLTYGPLLGLFIFGLFTKLNPHSVGIIVFSLISPVLSYAIFHVMKSAEVFHFGALLIGLNAFIMLVGLIISSIGRPKKGIEV